MTAINFSIATEPLGPAIVLVADPDPITADCATQLDSRYRTHVTPDARHALEYLRRGPADVVVADLGWATAWPSSCVAPQRG